MILQILAYTKMLVKVIILSSRFIEYEIQKISLS